MPEFFRLGVCKNNNKTKIQTNKKTFRGCRCCKAGSVVRCYGVSGRVRSPSPRSPPATCSSHEHTRGLGTAVSLACHHITWHTRSSVCIRLIVTSELRHRTLRVAFLLLCVAINNDRYENARYGIKLPFSNVVIQVDYNATKVGLSKVASTLFFTLQDSGASGTCGEALFRRN